MTEKGKDLLYKKERNVARITINRGGQRNAISAQAIALFLEYLDRARKDDDIRVVCITGSGDKVFCSGADLGKNLHGDEIKSIFNSYATLLIRIAQFPKPTVARINGHCLAGGTGFMLACDLVIARDDATFGTPEVNVGLFPMMIGALIFKNVLRKKAMEMILLGKKLNAGQALNMGMITRTVPPEDLDKSVNEVIKSLTEKSPLGLRMGKQAFCITENMELEPAIQCLSGKLFELSSTKDAAEGINAFLEKRKPIFIGE